MHCKNFSDVEKWFNEVRDLEFIVRRHRAVPVNQICTVSPTVELLYNVRKWKEDGNWNTFWHMKQLMISLKDKEVLLPIIMTRPVSADSVSELYYNVDPGGSRMIVLSHIDNKRTVPVDTIWPKKHLDELTQLGSHEVMTTVHDFLTPYEKIGIGYSMLLCHNSPCNTCIEHGKVHNNPYRYVVQWDRDWFYNEPEKQFKDWYEQNKDTVVEDIMDWYVI